MEADRRALPAGAGDARRDARAARPTLRDLPHCEDLHLVAATGASNVTGEIWPVAEIAGGARLRRAAAGRRRPSGPHAPIDMQRDGIDYLALSGHKLYAPYGAGALIGERDWLTAGDPFLRGGGAVKLVTVDETLWAELPDRQEAGSPNVIGAVALGVACDTLASAGMDRVAAEEGELLAYARDASPDPRVRALPGLARRAPARRAADLQPARRRTTCWPRSCRRSTASASATAASAPTR